MSKGLWTCYLLFLPITWLIPVSKAAVDVSQTIPVPMKVNATGGEFLLNNECGTFYSNENFEAAQWFRHELFRLTGIKLTLPGAEPTRSIRLILDLKMPDSLGREGYTMQIMSDKIEIKARHNRGLFYGLTTLLQAAWIGQKNEQVAIACADVTDKPVFGWRGMHLDVSRHFFTTDEVKRYMDYMALFKLNTLHLHLNDDQGWRLEIEAYPRLTSVGSKRKRTLVGHLRDKPEQYNNKPVEGFYTKSDIQGLVEYAQRRQINIVPEIDFPGHMQAAIAAYPWLSCTNQKIEVWEKWGVSENIMNPSDSSIQFLKNVFTEVAQMFPSKYVHIGGDEAVKNQWKNHPAVLKQMQAQKIDSLEKLQAWMIDEVRKHVKPLGKKLIGWDEIVEGGADTSVTVMVWRGWGNQKRAREATEKGYEVILSPTEYCYFDYYQADKKTQPLAIGGMLPMSKVYGFVPYDEVAPEHRKKIKGIQGNVWTEYIPTFQQVEYMAMPRMFALAEVAWTNPVVKNHYDFKARAGKVCQQLKLMKVRCGPVE